MSLKFYMDEHVPRAITVGLRLRGVDVLTAQEDGTCGLPDPVLLDRAVQLGRLIFTQDPDFLAQANRRQRSGSEFSGIIFEQQTSLSIGQAVLDLELIAKAGFVDEFRNRVMYLPLR